jgi:hypothetical protein
MSKEIWKLVELLNEYVEKYNKSDLYYKFELENWELYCYNDVSDVLWTMQDEAMVICSKKFWFIKWLVENEKIDTNKLEEKSDFRDVYYCFQPWKWKKYYDVLIMLLAIQDEPIEFLISILKNV